MKTENICFLLACLVAYIHCSCQVIKPTDCIFNGEIVNDGSTFPGAHQCETCSCSGGEISCCGFGRSIRDLADGCKIIEVEPCWEEAVLESDESKQCSYFTAVTNGRK
ncbi:uncharacterized protein LOC143080407 [Mytilus galloprovincialis]|uniref:uncharacterized protein LOC143080407 n=1 Tax=Mytilus galloprovincialis TaxID=29158 RepID=UPI003F7BF707